MKRTLNKLENHCNFDHDNSIIFFPKEILKIIVNLIINSSQTTEEIDCRIFTPFIYIYSLKQTCSLLNQIIKSVLHEITAKKQDWSFFKLYQWPSTVVVQQQTLFTKVQKSNIISWLFITKCSTFCGKYDDLISSKLDIKSRSKISLSKDLNLLITDAVKNNDFNLFLSIFQIYCCFLKTNYDVFNFEYLLLIASFTNNKVFIVNWVFQNCSDVRKIKDISCFTDIYESILIPIIENDYLDSFIRLTYNFDEYFCMVGVIKYSTLILHDKSYFGFRVTFREQIFAALTHKSTKILNYISKMPYFTNENLISKKDQQSVLDMMGYTE